MRLAIYGDSFGHTYPKTFENSWPFFLAEKIGAEELKNFSAGGTSTFYSYKLFLENYKNYDLNIFLVTDPYRYTKTIDFSSGSKSTISNISTLDALMRGQDVTDHDKMMAEYLKGWFISLDKEFMETVQELILKDIESKDPHVIFLPCFRFSMSDERKARLNLGDFFMMKFGVAQNQYLELNDGQKFGGRNFRENSDIMCCHMTPETNEFAAELIRNYIISKSMSDVPKIIPQKHTADHYYIFQD